MEKGFGLNILGWWKVVIQRVVSEKAPEGHPEGTWLPPGFGGAIGGACLRTELACVSKCLGQVAGALGL